MSLDMAGWMRVVGVAVPVTGLGTLLPGRPDLFGLAVLAGATLFMVPVLLGAAPARIQPWTLAFASMLLPAGLALVTVAMLLPASPAMPGGVAVGPLLILVGAYVLLQWKELPA